MKSVFRTLCLLLAWSVISAASFGDEGTAFFEKKIRPVLVEHCYSCHSAEAETLEGELLLDNRAGWMSGGVSGQIIVPGEPEKSLLLHAMKWKNADLEMPPEKKLPDDVLADFEKWIEMGAPDPREGGVTVRKGIDWDAAKKYWAFQPVEVVAPEKLENESWPRGGVDRYILARLEKVGIEPAGDANRYAVLRRLTFDLTGLPPTPEEIAAFVDDTSPQALEKVVDRLLESKQFGVHWGRHWLDGMRYRTRIGDIHVYRDWVIQSINDDKPYDQFVVEQIAGDLLPPKKIDDERFDMTSVIGTASLALQVGGCDLPERQLEVIGGQYLGMSIACARCHDHKFDPFSQEDYYALAGILQSSDIIGEKGGFEGLPIVSTQAQRELIEGIEKQWNDARKELGQLQKKLPKQYQLVQLRREAAKGSQRQIDRLNKLLEDQKKNGWDLNPPELPRIAELMQREREASQQLQKVKRAVATIDRNDPKDYPLLRNGERSQPGEIIPRRFPVIFKGEKQTPIGELTSGSGRLELARWIASSDNPLTARVMVNRIWQRLLGEGIVRTPNDFGATGEKPTHPLLLDYLANRFVENGWSVKSMIREIVLSRTYGLASNTSESNRKKDLINEYFGRANLKRLQYEQIIDSLYFVSGRLELNPTEEMLHPRFNDKTTKLRQIYDTRRNYGDLFDGPEDDLIVSARSESTTAPQMLFLLNGRDIAELGKAVATHTEKETSPGDLRSRLNRLYLRVLGRPVRDEDVTRAEAYLKNNPLERFCHALLCSNEFVYLD